MSHKETNCQLTDAELIDKANYWLKQLIDTGGKAWSLPVPANPDKDVDLIIGEVIDRLQKYVTPNPSNTVEDKAREYAEQWNGEVVSLFGKAMYATFKRMLFISSDEDLKTKACDFASKNKELLNSLGDCELLLQKTFIAGHQSALQEGKYSGEDMEAAYNAALDYEYCLSRLAKGEINTSDFTGQEFPDFIAGYKKK